MDKTKATSQTNDKNTDKNTNQEIPPLPEKFKATIIDFTTDLTTTFPEFSYLWAKWSSPTTTDIEYQQLFMHCLTVFPERFFDILNQNATIFDPNSPINTVFLPNVEFKMLFHCQGTSDKIKQTLWKYLQVILFMLIGSVKDKMDFGEAMNMFDGFEDGDLQDKLKDAMASIGDFFGKAGNGSDNTDGSDSQANAFKDAFEFINKMDCESGDGSTNSDNTGSATGSASSSLPNPEDLHDHLKNLFNGKIGKLAKELADDLGQDLADTFGDDMQNMKSTKDVFSKLMQNPQKISGLVKTVGEKLNKKMADGEISRDDIMGEAGELMRRMKEMGGAGQFADMFKNMAKGMGVNIPKGAKMDTNALKQMEKKMTARDKLKQRAEVRKQKADADHLAEKARMQKQLDDYRQQLAKYNLAETEDPHNFIFSLDGNEKQEKSMRPPTNQPLTNQIVNSSTPTLTANQKKNLKKKMKKQANKKETEAEVNDDNEVAETVA